MCISKNEKYRSGHVTVMRFDMFGALKKIRNEHFCLLGRLARTFWHIPCQPSCKNVAVTAQGPKI